MRFRKNNEPYTAVLNAKPVIIWDVGGVILDWDPVKFSSEYKQGEFKDACIAIFKHENWVKFDRGDLAYDDLIAIYSEQLQLSKQSVNDLFQAAFHSLKPKWSVIYLVKQLEDAGYEQYCLTNGSKEYLQHVTGEKFQEAYHFSLNDLFSDDRIVLSAKINIVKPEPEIYQHTEKMFDLQQRKNIFIDDNLRNSEAATAAGWNGIHFTTLQDCLQKLESVGIDVNSCSVDEMIESEFGKATDTAKEFSRKRF
jgi:putative hydrolase of the HAD superfamily